MGDRTFVYVDGESHFLRSLAAWREHHGDQASLERVRYAREPSLPLVLALPKAKVFWTRKMSPEAQRAIYFTSAVGNEPELHEVCLALRDFNLEPALIPELSNLAAHRTNVRERQRLIEKAKGVDITLTVRMLTDAYVEAYNVCHLYTSDVDFIPLIRAVQARGKRVHVYGYKNGLSERSELLHVPDLFTDLEPILRSECECVPTE
jgi:uncharacterized LabA/DUF88 family protein